MESRAVTVTAAIIESHGKVLVARRPPGGRHPGRWEFPGGKLEPGETLEQCVVREMLEEMDVEVAVEDMLASVGYSYPDLEIELVAFRCRIVGGDLCDIGCEAHTWVEPPELEGFDLLPADRMLLPVLFNR